MTELRLFDHSHCHSIRNTYLQHSCLDGVKLHISRSIAQAASAREKRKNFALASGAVGELTTPSISEVVGVPADGTGTGAFDNAEVADDLIAAGVLTLWGEGGTSDDEVPAFAEEMLDIGFDGFEDGAAEEEETSADEPVKAFLAEMS